MRKRIAVLVGQADETTQNRFLTGFIKQAYACDYDVCIFSMYQKYQETWLREIGDSNIFELINYDLFDAVLILLDTILTKDFSIPLQENVKEKFHGPVLVVDQESEFFDSVMIDHYTPVKKLVDHLIEVHGYQEIAFLGGKKGHPHSIQRLNGFIDSMNEHGLSIRGDWIYHANYWYDGGEEFVDLLLQNREDLPRAIACANDIMAIGAAARLTENGIRVPQDVAIIGYDSIEDGRYSPSPLTSAPIPADECGEYCLNWLDAAIHGIEKPVFKPKAPIFVGGSCGCHYEIELVPKKLRPVWRTQQSSRSMFSDFNHILEDLLSQTSMTDFWNTIRHYVYQIRPFYRFDMCMNNGFLNPESNIGEKALRKGYADTIRHVLSCTESGEEAKDLIDFDKQFPVTDLIPALHEEREYPTTYIFNPLFCDDRCFGYTVLNYGKEVKIYDESYRVWMRNITQGMEAFYRQQFLQSLVEQIQQDQIRDSMTGMYNYEGFIKQASRFANPQLQLQKQVNILTIDIRGLKTINEIYGHEYGDKGIRAVARAIQKEVREDEVCSRMCNDEFLIALMDNDEGSRGNEIITNVQERLRKYKFGEADFTINIHSANLLSRPSDSSALESVINHVISFKNHKKVNGRKKNASPTSDLMDEIKRNQIVDRILNQNLLTYHYQPIVSAEDGSIYAYEALMRCEVEQVSPFQIIQAAQYLNRLQDVEKATLLNVTADVEQRLEDFGNAKVFINSLPGHQISGSDDLTFSKRIRENQGRFVIEFTEESELNDVQLADLKEKYEELGNEIAIDDYGAGYSNVNNLLRYMPSYVKIDRQLITEIHNNPQKQHFVRNIIDFAHDNQVMALAEGVETREELKECIRMGIDLIQGYYTGKPARNPIGVIPDEISNEIRRFRLQRLRYSM